jgi:hypothetical protein
MICKFPLPLLSLRTVNTVTHCYDTSAVLPQLLLPKGRQAAFQLCTIFYTLLLAPNFMFLLVAQCLNQLCQRVPHVTVLALTYFHTSIYTSNHSVYLQISATGVSVYLPLKHSTAANVLTLPFIANNSKQVAHSGVKISDSFYRLSQSAVLIEDNCILTGIPDRFDSNDSLHYATLLRPLWSK